VFRLLNEVKLSVTNESDTKSIDINGDITFNNVNFAYSARKDVPVLRNLTLVARAGETTALVGSSGCGKSYY
jgi:ATP-binding cassette subfamily B (MDR/TAP) protein 1